MKRLFLLGILLLTPPLLIHAEECRYEPGAGWRPTDYPVYLGGYFSLWSGFTKDSQMVSIDEFALMLYGNFDRWRFMGEVEVEEPYTRYFGDIDDEETHMRMRLERLFVAYDIDDYSDVTVGKFFSDIGFWNTMPINVLRDTTSDPYLIETTFPMLTTGVKYHRYADLFEVTLTAQANDDFEEAVNNFKIDRHFAAMLTYRSQGTWRMGGGWYRETSTRESWYLSGAYRKEVWQWSVMAEAAMRKRDGIANPSYALYLQGVWHFLPKHDAVVRIENWDDPIGTDIYPKSRDSAVVIGYTYRPKPWLAFKGEFDGYMHRDERLLFSFSLLF